MSATSSAPAPVTPAVPTTAVSIEVSERLMDYWTDHEGKRQPKFHAQIAGQPGIWACGRTPDEAVGDLVRTHPAEFNVALKFIGKAPR